MRKIYCISIIVGIICIFIITIMIESLVGYYDEVKFRGVYGLGIMVGIILNSLFQEVIFWRDNTSKKRMEK